MFNFTHIFITGIVMIIIVTTNNILDKYKKQLRKHRLCVICGFQIYIFSDNYND